MAGYGRLLREARQRRGLSLEEAEAATRIRLRYLAALEAEDAVLPDPVYARGFLRTYARFLGLDPERLLSLYPQAPRPDLSPPPRPTPRDIPGSALFAIVLTLLLVASLVIYLSQRGGGNSPEGVVVTIQVPPTTPTTPAPTETSGGAASTATVSPSRASPTTTPTKTTPTPTAMVTNTPVPKVNLPDLTGITYSQATSRLANLGLQVAKVEEWSNQVAKDLVYQQDPAPGQALAPGSMVRLWVSRGPELVTVPNVVTKPEAEARQLLLAAGLSPAPYANRQRLEDLPESERQRHINTCVGCVLSTTPSSGAEVPPGTVVYLAVRA